MPKIWVTRSQPGAERSAAKLTALGYDTAVLPLLTLGPPDAPPPPLPGKAILIITSQNALWALVASTDRRIWPVVCVGDATAKLAQELGFANVYSASGTARDIAPLIRQSFPGDNRLFIHACGKTIRGDITGDLQALGYAAERHVYYSAHPPKDLSHVETNGMDTVLLYSPGAAGVLRTLNPNTSHMSAISISAETDKALGDLSFAKRGVAAAPNEPAMFTMLD